MGCTNPIGFFLHIPMPPPPIMAAIPEHEWLMRSLFAYDLVGFQTESDLLHFEHYVEAEAGAARLPDGRLRAFGHTLSAGAFPIGINVDEFESLARDRDGLDMFERMRDEYSRRQLLVGVDRLDYTKGLPQRVHAFRQLLEQYPENRNRATLIQIAAPSREDLGAYDDLRREMDSLCGAINGDYGELEWMPMRYIHRTVARKRLPGLYRASRVALVTLRDGMNLVAKEFLAAQDAADPGVLVLSRFAGAAEQLKSALLVNPYDTQGTAQAIQRALTMPLEERRQRHAALMAIVRKTDVHWWRTRFSTRSPRPPKSRPRPNPDPPDARSRVRRRAFEHRAVHVAQVDRHRNAFAQAPSVRSTHRTDRAHASRPRDRPTSCRSTAVPTSRPRAPGPLRSAPCRRRYARQSAADRHAAFPARTAGSPRDRSRPPRPIAGSGSARARRRAAAVRR